MEEESVGSVHTVICIFAVIMDRMVREGFMLPVGATGAHPENGGKRRRTAGVAKPAPSHLGTIRICNNGVAHQPH